LDFGKSATPGTLTNFDELDGGAGVDTLNLIVRGELDVPGGVSISNIEVINLDRDSSSGTIDASDFAGATQIWQIGDAGAIDGLVEGQTAGFRDTDAETGAFVDDVTAADGVTSVSVALDKAGQATASVPAEVALNIVGEDVTTLNVSGTIGTEGGKLSLIGLPEELETVNLALDSDTNLALYASSVGAFGSVTTFDASASTGDLVAGFGTVPELDLESVTFGSGNDAATLSIGTLTAESVIFDLGAGNDIFSITNTTQGATAAAITVTGGEGNDTLVLGDLKNVTDASEANFMDSLITFADFNVDEDVIVIDGPLTALSNVQLANIAAADDLFAAVGLAADFTEDQVVAFDFGGNAYIYGNSSDSDDGFTPDDGLVQLTGVSISDFDASNVIFNGMGYI